MLINFSNYLKKTNALSREYRGTVVNNVDPLRIGRIQVNIPNFIEGDQTNLPWVYQKSPAKLGGSGNSSGFAVPEIGNEVFVEFKGDVYAMFYSFYWQSATTHQADFDEDYPASYGDRDLTGNLLKINKAKQFLEFIHSSGMQFFVDNDANGSWQSDTTLTMTSSDGATQIVLDMVNGNITLQAKNQVSIDAPNLDLNVSTITGEQGNHNDTVTGYRNSQIYGSYVRSIGSDDGEAILGNKVSTVAGNKSELVSGTTSETFGLAVDRTIVSGDDDTTVNSGNKNNNITGNKTNTISGNYQTTAGGTVTSTASGDNKINGANVRINSGPGNVLTTITDPVVDLITGVPTQGVPTFFA